MKNSWQPTASGKFFTSTPDWSLELLGEQFVLTVQGKRMGGDVELLEKLAVTKGAVWAALTVYGANGNSLQLDGLPNNDAAHLKDSLTAAIEAKRHRKFIEELTRQFDRHVRPLVDWARVTVEACKALIRQRGWLGQEFTSSLDSGKSKELTELLMNPDLEPYLEAQSEAVRGAMKLWRKPSSELVSGINRRQADQVTRLHQSFFDSVEKSPLTSEQREAVICFDNRVLLVASAGSGKTSTMVAKAGYALKLCYFAADKMLLLAFNTDAAAELRERIQARLVPLGLPADKIVAKTFHAFGLDVIGMTTGKRPSIAPWLEQGQDQAQLLLMADELKDRDPVFRATWDMFRLVFGQDLPKFGKEEQSPESWDPKLRRGGFWTLNNETVKSRGELVIANWLSTTESGTCTRVPMSTRRPMQAIASTGLTSICPMPACIWSTGLWMPRANRRKSLPVTRRACSGSGPCIRGAAPNSLKPPWLSYGRARPSSILATS